MLLRHTGWNLQLFILSCFSGKCLSFIYHPSSPNADTPLPSASLVAAGGAVSHVCHLPLRQVKKVRTLLEVVKPRAQKRPGWPKESGIHGQDSLHNLLLRVCTRALPQEILSHFWKTAQKKQEMMVMRNNILGWDYCRAAGTSPNSCLFWGVLGNITQLTAGF